MEALDPLAWPVGRLGEAIVALARLQGWWLRAVEAPLRAEVEQLLQDLGVTKRRHAWAQLTMLGEQLSAQRLRGCWLLRLPADASFWRQMRQARLPHRLLGLLGAYALQYLCWL